MTQSRFYRVFQPLVFEGNKPCYAHERQQFKYYERIQERELFLKQAELNRIKHKTIHHQHQAPHGDQAEEEDDDKSTTTNKKKVVKSSLKTKKKTLHKKALLASEKQHQAGIAAETIDDGNMENDNDYIDYDEDDDDAQTTRDLQTQEDTHPMEPVVDININTDIADHHHHHHRNNSNAASSIVANATLALQGSSSPPPAPKRFYVSKFAADGGRNNVDIEADAKMGITEEVRQHGWRRGGGGGLHGEKNKKKKHSANN